MSNQSQESTMTGLLMLVPSSLQKQARSLIPDGVKKMACVFGWDKKAGKVWLVRFDND